MSYEAGLLEAKNHYPFAIWRSRADDVVEDGLEQYTEENCNAAKKILDDLITSLALLGAQASEAAKLEKFQIAVEALNELNEEIEFSLIETEEAEQLVELFNIIAVKAGIDPYQYGSGEGPASEWRDW